MASDGSRAVGRTIGRSASRRSDVFRTVDRSQSSHAYSTALSTPPSQEGKNHPRGPGAPLGHPYPQLERKRREEDEAIAAAARIDRWGRGGEKERKPRKPGVRRPRRRQPRSWEGCSRDFLHIPRRLLSTVEDNRETTSNHFHEIVLREIRQTSGETEPPDSLSPSHLPDAYAPLRFRPQTLPLPSSPSLHLRFPSVRPLVGTRARHSPRYTTRKCESFTERHAVDPGG